MVDLGTYTRADLAPLLDPGVQIDNGYRVLAIRDSTHTQALVDDLNAGGMQVELTLVAGGDHLDTAFGFLARQQKATAESVSWVLARLQ